MAIDGTKVLANASQHAAVSYPRAGEQRRPVELEIEQLLAKAEAVDAQPLQDGLTVEGELTRQQARKAQLQPARAEREARACAATFGGCCGSSTRLSPSCRFSPAGNV